jgi:hypothetical protein
MEPIEPMERWTGLAKTGLLGGMKQKDEVRCMKKKVKWALWAPGGKEMDEFSAKTAAVALFPLSVSQAYFR